MTTRQIGNVLYQGVDEQIIYSVTTTAWGTSPASVETKVYDISDGSRTDVTLTVMTGSATVTGDIISLPVLKLLTARSIYRVEVKFTAGGNVFEPYFVVIGEN